jgi:hypothetical protein
MRFRSDKLAARGTAQSSAVPKHKAAGFVVPEPDACGKVSKEGNIK